MASINDLQRFLSSHYERHFSASDEGESILCVKPSSRNILHQNINFQPSLTQVFSSSFDVGEDARAYSESSVFFCDAQARHNQALVEFLNRHQSDNFRFQFDEIAGNPEEGKRPAINNMKYKRQGG